MGGVIPSVLRLTHRRLQIALSFVAGTMLGVALFHMLPHAALEAISTRSAEGGSFGHADFDRLTVSMVAGFLAMFLLERFAQFHRHESDEAVHAECDHSAGEAHAGRSRAGHSHASQLRVGPGGAASARSKRDRPQRSVAAAPWVGALVGLSVHALLEGVALAAAVLAGAGLTHGHDHGEIAGFGVFLVIVLHKPFDSMSLLTLVHAADAKARRRTLLLNVVFALMVPIGAAAFCLGAAPFIESTAIVPLALAFSAGTFLCIASSDLLPELQFHRHDRGVLSAALVLGLVVAWGIGLFEADHFGHGATATQREAGDGSSGAMPHDHDHAHEHSHDH